MDDRERDAVEIDLFTLFDPVKKGDYPFLCLFKEGIDHLRRHPPLKGIKEPVIVAFQDFFFSSVKLPE